MKDMILDDELIIVIQKGGAGAEQAFASLVNAHARRFYALAHRTLYNKDEAEDVVQEAFLKLWGRPEIYKTGQVKFTTWFSRVVINAAIDRNRKTRPQADVEMEWLEDDKVIPIEARIDESRQYDDLEEALQDLPERQKTALNLCFYEGLSNKEAADIMDVGVKALESLLMRAKASLKVSLRDQIEKGVQVYGR